MVDLSVNIEKFVRGEYGIEVEKFVKLSGYEDLNYVISCSHQKTKLILKIVNASDSMKEG